MKILAVQLLASIAVFSSISFSQKDKEGKGHTNYLLFDKTINVEEIIRIGERKSETVRENAEKKESNKSQLSSFLTKISNVYKLNNDMFQSKGLQWFNNTDNSTGTAFVCGKYLFLFFYNDACFLIEYWTTVFKHTYLLPGTYISGFVFNKACI